MNTLKNVQKISLVFFIILGLSHIVSGLMAANNYYPGIMNTTNKILDIPFAVAAILYGASTFKLSFQDHKLLNAIMIIGIILVLAALVYINFFVPDLNAR